MVDGRSQLRLPLFEPRVFSGIAVLSLRSTASSRGSRIAVEESSVLVVAFQPPTIVGMLIIIAGSGLSDCVSSGPECSAGLDWALMKLAFVGVMICVWFFLAVYVASVANSEDIGKKGVLVSVISAWVIPVLGALVYVWLIRKNRSRKNARRSRH